MKENEKELQGKKEERKEKVISIENKREEKKKQELAKKSKEKRDAIISKIIAGIESIIMTGVILCIGVIILGTILSNTYYEGFSNGEMMSYAYEDVKDLYAGKNVTAEQYNEFSDAYQDIVNVTLINSKISIKMIKRYNKSIKDISYIDYGRYKLEGVSVWYKRGLQDKIKIEKYSYLIESACNDGIVSEVEKDSFGTIKSNAKTNHKGSTLVIEKAEEILNKGKNL